jgi:hypothetical protein
LRLEWLCCGVVELRVDGYFFVWSRAVVGRAGGTRRERGFHLGSRYGDY